VSEEPRVRPQPRRKPVRIVALTAEKVADYIDRILKTATWLTPADFPLVTQAARSLVIADQVWSYFEQRQWIDSRGRPRGAVKQYLALQNTIGRQLNALGFSPLARAELQRLAAGAGVDLATLMRQARADGRLAKRDGSDASPPAIEGPTDQGANEEP